MHITQQPLFSQICHLLLIIVVADCVRTAPTFGNMLNSWQQDPGLRLRKCLSRVSGPVPIPTFVSQYLEEMLQGSQERSFENIEQPRATSPTKSTPCAGGFKHSSPTVVDNSGGSSSFIPSISRLRSGSTNFVFNTNDKTWTNPSGIVLQESNNQIFLKPSASSPSSSPVATTIVPDSTSIPSTVNSWESSPYAPGDSVQPANDISSGPNTALVKRMLSMGVAEVLGSDAAAKAYVYAIATTETSMGQNMPSSTDGSKNYRKIGTDAEEIGCTRISRHMVKDLGYGESHISTMNSGTADGIKLSGIVTAQALRKYGMGGFIHYQRGGSTQYDNYRANKLSSSEQQSANALQTSYRVNQKGNLVHNLVDDNTGKFAVTSVSVASI